MPKLTHTDWSRRQFLKFMGAQGLLLTSGCSHWAKGTNKAPLPFTPLAPSRQADLKLASGFTYQRLISWLEPINNKGDLFGFDNDYVAFMRHPDLATNEALLWVNHESFDPRFATQFSGKKISREEVLFQQKQVGGSLLRIRKEQNRWSVVPDDGWNFRLDGTTPIPINAPRPIHGTLTARGTLHNCSGGLTPWGNILTCEENYHKYYGEIVYDKNNQPQKTPSHKLSYWDEYFPEASPEHYGWVVEIDPKTQKAQKLTSLGRFCHESATVEELPDGRCVVYSGDDAADQCIYKFIAEKPGSLQKGTLYVANVEAGRWLPLDRERNPKLKAKFKDQLELLIRTREAAHLVGGTPLDRPEDIAVDPYTKNVFVSQTNNKKKNDYYGSLLKIEEKDGNPESLEFTASIFKSGGPESGFACPDNLAFDQQGNLWMTTDMSERSMGEEGPYADFGNNGLFCIPLQGPHAGQFLQVASAPYGAEFTGPCFSDDQKTLFLAVQHPGSDSADLNQPTTRWPFGGDSLPKASVVQISGPSLEALTTPT